MSRTTQSFLAATTALLVLLAAATALAFLPPRQTDEVAAPAADASPEEVVRIYLAALDAHDCDTAEATSTPESRETARRWCRRVAHLSDVTVEKPVGRQPQWSGRRASDQVVGVQVTFTLDWRRFHDDGSMPEGSTLWGYELVRSGPGEPWRISGQGMG